MRPEFIILIAFALIAGYIIIEVTINNKKIKGKDSKAKKPSKSDKKDHVELQTVVTPKADHNLFKDTEDEIMAQAAKESIEHEKKLKAKLLEKQEKHNAQLKQEEQEKINKEIKEMRKKLDSIDLNKEEKSFLDEVDSLSPQMRAILFADILKRKGY